jgi:hypothetical protein
MHNPVRMDLVQCFNKLSGVASRKFGLKSIFKLHQMSKSPILAMLKDEEKLVLFFEFADKLDNKRFPS